MKQGKVLGVLLLVFLVGCNPFARKKAKVNEDLSEFMSSTPLAEVERSGSFIAEDDDSLQERLLERFKETQCAKQWIGFLQRRRFGVIVSQMRPSLDSEERIVNSDGSESYFLPTTLMGHWVEIRKFRSRSRTHFGRVELREFYPVKKSPSLMRQRIYRWRARKQCKRSHIPARRVKLFPYAKGAYPYRDNDLRKLVRKGAGLIYLWSPNMPYSTASIRSTKKNWGLDTLLDIAAEKNLGITYLLDPYANVPAALRAAEKVKKKVPRLKDYKVIRGTSIELYMRMTGLHYPTLLYYKDGKIARTHLPGISGEKQIRTYIDEQEKELAGISFRSKYQKEAE